MTTPEDTPKASPLHWRRKGKTLVTLAVLLDGYIIQRGQHPHRAEQVRVQADEALLVAANQWLWRGIAEALTTDDWESLADDVRREADNLFSQGAGWKSDVWRAVASALYEAAEK